MSNSISTDGLRNLLPFEDKMQRFHHDVRKAIDNAYVICCQSNPGNSCSREKCAFYSGECNMMKVYAIMGDL